MAACGPTHATARRAGALCAPDNATGGMRRAVRVPARAAVAGRAAARGRGAGGHRGAIYHLCGRSRDDLPRGHDAQQPRGAAVEDGGSLREPPASQDPHRPRRPRPQVRYREAGCRYA